MGERRVSVRKTGKRGKYNDKQKKFIDGRMLERNRSMRNIGKEIKEREDVRVIGRENYK